jgi:O-antigen/teichoic acid export membrane protein
MSIKKSLIKNTGFNLAGYAYLLLASFFSISLLLAHLGRDVFGVYLFLASFIALSSIFDFGVSNAVVRKLSLPQSTREEKVKTWKTSFAIYIALGFLVMASVMSILLYLTRTMPLFAHIDGNTLNWSILFLSLIVFVNLINSHFLNLPQAEQRFDIFNSKTLLVGSANTILSALLSGIYPNIALLFLLQLVFHVFTFLFMLRYSLGFFSGKNFSPAYDHQTGKELFSFGIKNFIGTLAGQLEAQASNFTLGAMVSAQAITSFSIPQNIVTKSAGIVSQFAQAFFPLSASLLAKDRINKLKKLVLGIQGLTLLAGFVAIALAYTVGGAFLTWWLHEPVVVAAALPILKILSIYFVLIALTPIPTALIQGLNKPQVPSFFAVLTTGLELIFMLLLIPHYQALGAAYAFLFSAAITVPTFLIVTCILLEKEIKRTQSLDETPLQTTPVSVI